MEPSNDGNRIVAIVTAILGIAFVVFVFVYDDLKATPFVQGITGLFVALVIAIVLFSAVPGSKAYVKLPIGLAGAAAFYFVLLPRVQPFIFPFYSYTGYVAYESVTPAEKGFTPVEGAHVGIKDTELKASTNSAGQFIISNIPSQTTVKQLVITRAGQSYIIATEKHADKIFRIPREPKVIKSSIFPIGTEDWMGDKADGCTADKNKYVNTAQYLLKKNVHKNGDYSDLVVRVWSPNTDVEIITARKIEPLNGSKVVDEAGYSQAQKWQLPMDGDMTQVNLVICVGATRKGITPSKSNLQASYWFEKVE